MEKPSKALVEERMDQEWAALDMALSGLSDEQMLKTGVVSEWSVKDLLGHMAFWTQQAAKNTELVNAGRQDEIARPDSPEATDRWNARERFARADRPLAEVRRELEESRRRALAALADLPDEKLNLELDGGIFLELYAVDTYDHYREHIAQVLSWRKRLENM
jgi:uncharacterized protein (TIGR03083 family)